MKNFVITFLVGLVVSIGALVSDGFGVAWAGNWNVTEEEKILKRFKPSITFKTLPNVSHIYKCDTQGMNIGYEISNKLFAFEYTGNRFDYGDFT